MTRRNYKILAEPRAAPQSKIRRLIQADAEEEKLGAERVEKTGTDQLIVKIEVDNEDEFSKYRDYFKSVPAEWYEVVKVYNPTTKKYRSFFHCRFPRCNKEFTKISNLRNHLCKHDGQKPFVCHLCAACYT